MTDTTRPDGRPTSRRAYLDAAAVAPLHPQAREVLLAALDDGWADPRRLHHEGRTARLLLDAARETLAGLLGARPDELVLTGSHAVAVQSGVLGLRTGRRRSGPVTVLSAVEHSAVLHAAAHPLSPGAAAQDDVRTVPVDRSGRVDVDGFAAAVRADGVALACLQAANAEVGTVQPVEQVAQSCAEAGVPLLVDLTGSAGVLPVPAGWSGFTADPRAWGGPGGVGVLGLRTGTRWSSPWPEDDGTERVPGTVPVPEALAAAAALTAVAQDEAGREVRHRLVDRIRAAAAAVPDTEVAGDPVHRLPHVVTFSCLYVDGEALVTELDRRGFAVGSGSACTASSLQPSHVLAAMGLLTHGNVRVGLPAGVDPAAVEAFCAALPEAVAGVRALLGAEDL